MLFSVPGIYVSVDPNRSEIRYFWSWSALFRYNSKSVNRPSLSKISIFCSGAGPVGSPWPRPRPISNHAVQLKIKKNGIFVRKSMKFRIISLLISDGIKRARCNQSPCEENFCELYESSFWKVLNGVVNVFAISGCIVCKSYESARPDKKAAIYRITIRIG